MLTVCNSTSVAGIEILLDGSQARKAREMVVAALAAQAAEVASELAQLLTAAFSDDQYPPHSEFGNFSVILGPPATEWADVGILQAQIGEPLSGIQTASLGIGYILITC